MKNKNSENELGEEERKKNYDKLVEDCYQFLIEAIDTLIESYEIDNINDAITEIDNEISFVENVFNLEIPFKNYEGTSERPIALFNQNLPYERDKKKYKLLTIDKIRKGAEYLSRNREKDVWKNPECYDTLKLEIAQAKAFKKYGVALESRLRKLKKMRGGNQVYNGFTWENTDDFKNEKIDSLCEALADKKFIKKAETVQFKKVFKIECTAPRVNWIGDAPVANLLYLMYLLWDHPEYKRVKKPSHRFATLKRCFLINGKEMNDQKLSQFYGQIFKNEGKNVKRSGELFKIVKTYFLR